MRSTAMLIPHCLDSLSLVELRLLVLRLPGLLGLLLRHIREGRHLTLSLLLALALTARRRISVPTFLALGGGRE